jgi:hypothetical protein
MMSLPRPEAKQPEAVSLALALLFLILALAYLAFRPERVYTCDHFFSGDTGFQMSVTDQLLAGKKLYQEVFSPYGAIPVWGYLLLPRFFGNTPAVFMLSLALAHAMGFWIGVRAVRRACPRGWPATLAVMVLGSFLWREWAASPTVMYLPYEVMLLFLIALLWREPGRRGWGREVVVGSLAGLLQWVKFGDGVVAVAALVGADGLYLFLARQPWSLRALSKSWALLAGTWLATESLRAAWLAWTLPAPVFTDVFFPLFMVEHYKAAIDAAEVTLTHYQNFGVLVMYQLPLLVMMVIGLGGMVKRFRSARRKACPALPAGFGPALFFLSYFTLAHFVLFKHCWLDYEHAWLVALPLGVLLECFGRPVQLIATFAFAALVSSIPLKFAGGSADASRLEFPNGQSLWAGRAQENSIRGLLAALDRLPHQGQVITCLQHGGISSDGTGLYHFAAVHNPTRHNWYLPHWVRPYEEDEVLNQILSSDGIVFHNFKNPPRDYTSPAAWQDFRWSPLSSRANQKIQEQFVFQESIGNEWVILRPKSAPPGAPGR